VIEKKYKTNILSLADALRKRPFNFERAANALTAWVCGDQPLEPLRAIPCCAVSCVPTPAPLALASAFLPGAGAGAMSFEPTPGPVSIRVSSDRALLALRPPSEEAVFIAQIARTLVREHGFSFDGAVQSGRKCWADMVLTYRAFASGHVVPDAATCARPEDEADDRVLAEVVR